MNISDLFERRQSLRKFYFCNFRFLLPSHSDAQVRPKMFTFNSNLTSKWSFIVLIVRPEMQNYILFCMFSSLGGVCKPAVESYLYFLRPSLITLFTKSKLLPEHDCGIKFSRI